MAEVLSTENDIPIVFYGKLEDQFGRPVAGAVVVGNTTIYNGTRAGAEHVSSTSDAGGLFQITAGKGESLGIMPRKEGYALATAATDFKYSHMYRDYYVPDASNPTTIRMWKLQGPEPLLGISQRYKVHYTNGPVIFDLLTGKMVPSGGDLKITVSRSPGVVSERTLQDWGVQVEAVNGGLIESSGEERITYWAPESGYQLRHLLVLSTNPPNKWSGGVARTFFLKSRDGQVYSKVNFGISINQDPDDYVWVEFHGIANTNSSRNWEGDANTLKPQ